MKLYIGLRVFWRDPDPDLDCSGVGMIVHMQHDPPFADSVIDLDMDGGGEVEAFPHELEPLEDRE
jgi:hypothetical protein